jgi:hypothetical protein
MKLNVAMLPLAAQLLEFDVWITPSLGEIRDTDKFKKQMEAVVKTFEAIGAVTGKFKDVKDCQPVAIADTFIDLTRDKTEQEAGVVLEELASVLFLVTGKSDNNAKCQLPLFLRDQARWENLPVVRRSKGTPQLASGPIPRELKAEKYLGLVAELSPFHDQQKRLLEQFVSFLLNDEACVSQLWSIGYSYFMLKGFSKERDLLTPLVVFQVRGSVAASGGHDPEELLRKRLAEWGLQAGVDYNKSDVVLTEVLKILASTAVVEEVRVEPADVGATEREGVEVTQTDDERVRVKTRAYDFILPFKVGGWKPKVFVQSQFYAGDSGSVSHKNVDQTSTSRTAVQRILADARFVEYVDGAGYFSSLNGDLKTLLNMPNTASFCQVRSAAIRLRRELQHVGFLTPLEVEHAIFRSDGTPSAVRQVLRGEGYEDAEIDRAIMDSTARGLLVSGRAGKLSVSRARREVSRRYLLLDVAALLGSAPATPSEQLSGCLLVPGYGPFHGIKLDQLVTEAIRFAPALGTDLNKSQVMLADIRWLCEQGMAMSS